LKQKEQTKKRKSDVIVTVQWEDRKQWSLGVGQRRKSFETGDDDDDVKKRSVFLGMFDCASLSRNNVYYQLYATELVY
jgi:hypothetical protein